MYFRLEGDGEFTDTDGQVWTGTFRYKAAPGLRFKLGLWSEIILDIFDVIIVDGQLNRNISNSYELGFWAESVRDAFKDLLTLRSIKKKKSFSFVRGQSAHNVHT